MMRIVLAEIWYRRWASLFTTLVVAAVVATVVFFVLSSELAARRTQIIQKATGSRAIRKVQSTRPFCSEWRISRWLIDLCPCFNERFPGGRVKRC